ncbi:hypothetical protein BSKO_11918 [Bryopsis sp. KO-2023]|nr:hypothetical protein BSKO_11918 [Bryopsis sp. KO-2023]
MSVAAPLEHSRPESTEAKTQSGSEPVWFDPERFRQPEFDAEQYVADLRRFVPLEGLSKQLDNHLGQLKQKLVEVINENYNAFVSLGSQLTGVEGAILRIGKPVQELKGKLDDICEKIQGERSALHSALEKRKQIAAAREKLELMQHAVQLEGKVEKLILEVKGAVSMDLDSKSSLLERVAGEVGKLDLLISQGKELPFIQGVEQRTKPAHEELRKHLASCLAASLAENCLPATFHLLHAFSLAGDLRAGEQVIRSVIVKPLVQEAIGAANGKPDLGTISEKLLAGLEQRCKALFDRVHSADSALQGFNFLGNAVAAELHLQLAENLPAVFSPGVPSIFHTSYKAVIRFLEGLEGYCKTSSAIESLRNCEPVGALLRRWNLQVYYTLRFQEIAGSVERCFREDQFSVASEDELQCEPMVIWWQGVRQCLADDVCLAPLLDSFVKLLLQLVSRLTIWVNAGIQEDPAPSSFPSTSEDRLLLHLDLTTLHERIHNHTAARLQQLLGPLVEEEVCTEIVDSVRLGASEFLACQEKILAKVVDAVSQACGEVLKKCVGTTVGTMFRAQNQAAPTQPSEYVKRILEPLLQLVENPKVEKSPQEVRSNLVSQVADRTCARYEESLHELLTILKKSRLSLKRIKSRASESASQGDDSDRRDLDGVFQQHFLDVKELGRILEGVGVEVGGLESFRKLWGLVAPQDQKEVDVCLSLEELRC